MTAIKERPILFSAPMVLALLAGTKTQTRRIVKFEPYEKGYNLGFSGVEAGFFHSGLESSGWVLRSRGAGGCWNDRTKPLHSPYGRAGDRLWVRETFSTDALSVYPCPRAWYRADFNTFDDPSGWAGEIHSCPADRKPRANWADCWACQHESKGPFRWKPSIHMTRALSRLTLEVTGVRVERLQAISEEDAIAEGVERDSGIGCAGWWRDYLNLDCAVPSARDSYRTLWESINGAGSWAANPWVWVVSLKRVAP